MKSYKLKFYSILAVIILIISAFSGCGETKKTNANITTVRLNEVTRSIFYAPMYAALSQGFFTEEGLKIDLTIGEGADKTMQQVLSKSADIGFCGPEQVIYINNQNREDYPVIFAQLTETDGSFLVGRQEEKDFKWESLKGKTVVGGRPGGVPEMAFKYVLKKHNLQPGKDINIITNIAFAAVTGAFKGGTGDYATIFEPNASMLKKSNAGYLVASVGKEIGTIPYTCFFSTKSYMDKNPEVIEKFTRAIYKGQLWIQKHSDEEVSKAIKSFFPGTDEDIIISVIKNYRAINAYAFTPILKEENLNKLMDIMEAYKASLIPERPSFNKIVNNSFGEKAIKELN